MTPKVQRRPASMHLILLAGLILIISAMTASARPQGYGREHEEHEQYGEQQTDYYRPAYGHEEPEYREHEPEEYHRESKEDKNEYHGPSHDEYEEKKPKYRTICLQKTRTEFVPDTGSNTTGEFIDEFRCCKPEDETARTACLSETLLPDTQYPYPEDDRKGWQDDDMLDSMLGQVPVMRCESRIVGTCPAFISDSNTCFKFQTNCTLSLKASECGCPPDLTYFQAELYGRPIDVLSCSNKTLGGAADGPYQGTGFILQGAIKYILTHEGLREAKGSVKVINFQEGPPTGMVPIKVTDPSPELPLVQSGRLIIKLQEGSEYK